MKTQRFQTARYPLRGLLFTSGAKTFFYGMLLVFLCVSIAQGQRATVRKDKSAAPIRIACVGNSITYGGGLQAIRITFACLARCSVSCEKPLGCPRWRGRK